jgi:hypothetical protein
MTLNFRFIWIEKRPATAPKTIDFTKLILYTMTNLSAGQIVTIPAKLLVLTRIFYLNTLVVQFLCITL